MMWAKDTAFIQANHTFASSFLKSLMEKWTDNYTGLGEAHWLRLPTLARPTICMSCFIIGGPGKEHGTNKPPPTSRVQERSKGDTTCLTTSRNPSLWHPSWLNKACTTRKDSESESSAKDNLETNPITIKPETAKPGDSTVFLGSLP